MVIKDTWCPDRSDIIWLTFDPSLGHEQRGRRPALVISPRMYNEKIGLVLVCPITNVEKGYPFEIRIPRGLSISGVILADHVKNLDWKARDAEFVFKVPSFVTDEVLDKLAVLLS
jgi:mRNA interferase MazF